MRYNFFEESWDKVILTYRNPKKNFKNYFNI